MASEMMEALMALCEEKHIDQLELIDRLEDSLAKSYADVMKLDWGAKVTIDRATGKVYVYKLVPKEDSDMDEEGNFLDFDEVDVTPKNASRTAAMHAKGAINDMVRHAARQQIFDEFKDRIGDIITGTVLQTTPDFAIIRIREGVEAELPYFDQKKHPEERNERPRNERYNHGKTIRAIIIDVRDPEGNELNPKVTSRDESEPVRPRQVKGERQRPAIVVSRTSPELVRRLFELEVPEVYDGVVQVNSVARDPGVRSKVAVSSIDDRLDPVGACVGPKGSRVRSVVSELSGERVDVVLWSDDLGKRVANALSPARVSRVIVDEETSRATVIVPDDQLSLAIGKEGQNARLAARLTGMHIDIKNESLAAEVLRQLPKERLEEEPREEGGHRCEYVGPTGIQCRNMARPGSRYCGIHEQLQQMGDLPVSDDPDSLI